jgi:hypothetical protein
MRKMLSVILAAGPMLSLPSGSACVKAAEMSNDAIVNDIAMQNRIQHNQGICDGFSNEKRVFKVLYF